MTTTTPETNTGTPNNGESMKYGTFSYLEPMDLDQIRVQAQWMIDHGWNCAIEHVEPARATTTYWFMWKLPFFGEREVDRIMDELEACRAKHPTHLRRLIGYDNERQTQGLALVLTP